MGGMLGESKFDILTKLPASTFPKSVRVRIPATVQDVATAVGQAELAFPLIFKPDLGERGYMVQRVDTLDEIDEYLRSLRSDLIIQELVDLPLEFGVFYRRYPSEPKGEVTSIVVKEMLSVIGDGESSLEVLIQSKDRALLHIDRLRLIYADQWDRVLTKGEIMELVSIGNHCLGTKFLDGNEYITPQLSASFDAISKQVDGFYFGRFDLRCGSIDDLQKGKVMVMELNGCGAEPAHIYHPGFPLWKALGVMARHWSDMFRISMENRQRGFSFTSVKDAVRYYKTFKEAIKS